MMRYPIKTQRLIIRLAEPEDAESIFSYRSDLEENKYQGWFPDSVEEVREYIGNMPQTMDVADVCFQFAIINADEKRFGCCLYKLSNEATISPSKKNWKVISFPSL